MDKFDELELNGRKLLESFLMQVGATNLHLQKINMHQWTTILLIRIRR